MSDSEGLVAEPGQLTDEQIDLLKRTICKDATDDELALFLNVCRSKNLDPFSHQIYAIKRWDNSASREIMSYQTGIDGFRLIADRTTERDGEDAAEWCGDDGTWKEVWLDKKPPRAARIRVYRKNVKRAYTGLAQWEFYAQKKRNGDLSSIWAKGGPHMLAKCAEALALRKAFPRELSGLYTRDEMGQANNAPAEYKAVASVHVPPELAEPVHQTGPTDSGFGASDLDQAVLEQHWAEAYGLATTQDEVQGIGQALAGQIEKGPERDELIKLHWEALQRCEVK